jgi:hypothetical protein
MMTFSISTTTNFSMTSFTGYNEGGARKAACLRLAQMLVVVAR